MRSLILAISISFLCLTFCSSGTTEKKNDDSSKRDVLVVAHRGDWRNYPENSLEAIQSCIDMGIDIVEIDIAKTKDGYLIVMHDRTLDRTTNGKGNVKDFTLEKIKTLRLKNGTGRTTSTFSVPTLEEAMLLAKGKIKVNLDKADQFFDDIYTVLEKTGTVDQVIIKSNKPYNNLREKFGKNLDKMVFMPIVIINTTTTIESITPLLDAKYPMYELVFGKENKELLLEIKAKLKGTSSRIWINSLWESLCGGYSDNKALKDPNGTWGYLIDTLGASVLQTDRPELMLNYLQQKKSE